MADGEPKGIFDKYDVRHADGHDSPGADYFVLRLDRDRYARVAALAYSRACWKDNPELAQDLINKVAQYDQALVIGALAVSFENPDIWVDMLAVSPSLVDKK